MQRAMQYASKYDLLVSIINAIENQGVEEKYKTGNGES